MLLKPISMMKAKTGGGGGGGLPFDYDFVGTDGDPLPTNLFETDHNLTASTSIQGNQGRYQIEGANSGSAAVTARTYLLDGGGTPARLSLLNTEIETSYNLTSGSGAADTWFTGLVLRGQGSGWAAVAPANWVLPTNGYVFRLRGDLQSCVVRRMVGGSANTLQTVNGPTAVLGDTINVKFKVETIDASTVRLSWKLWLNATIEPASYSTVDDTSVDRYTTAGNVRTGVSYNLTATLPARSMFMDFIKVTDLDA